MLEIQGRVFSNGHCLIVAEIAQAHDGSLGQAHAYIDAVANAGADAIKFQTHIAAAESTPNRGGSSLVSRTRAAMIIGDAWSLRLSSGQD